MIYEGVNFNETVINGMTAEEFEKRHKDLFWLDRDEATRAKMLSEAYSQIMKASKKAKMVT